MATIGRRRTEVDGQSQLCSSLSDLKKHLYGNLDLISIIRYHMKQSLFTEGKSMSQIIRKQIDERWADSEIIQAGDFVFIGYCMRNEGESVTSQMNGAFDVLEERLKTVGLSLDSVVKMDCLFKNINDLEMLPSVIKERFSGKYPARKAYETNFIREGISFQIDAIAYREQN
jgi:2-iminobutanoate/2-iminopropanoate deaminase